MVESAGEAEPELAERRPGLAYAIAVGGTVLLLLVRVGLSETLERRASFLLFVVSITLSAWFGGLRPGLVATVCASLVGWFGVLDHQWSFHLLTAGDALNLILFAGVGVCISVVCERMLDASARARTEAEVRRLNVELERRVDDRTRELRSSEQEAARRSAKLGAILGSVVDALVIADGEGKLVDMNAAWLALYGYESAEQARRAADEWEVLDLDGEPLTPERRPLARVLAGERFNDLEVQHRHRETGREMVVACSGAPVADPAGDVVRAILVVRDVSDRRRSIAALRASEEAAQRSLAQLEVVLSERDALLASERAARAEFERANRMKDEFLAVLSHELRTPLNAIVGWAGLLRRPARTPEQIDKGLEVIDRNARVQVQLISDLLDVSRIVVGKLHIDLAPIDVAVVVESAVDGARAAASAKRIELHASVSAVDALVHGDSTRLQQIVGNLLSNAIKFTPPGGRVGVGVARAGSHVEIAVRDTGQGIAPEFLPRVFDRFRQADASITRQHGGLGLGLAIVKHLVTLHGGDVRVESPGVGLGATFTVSLPCEGDTAPLGTTAPISHEGTQLHGVRVLVVDDEHDARELVQRVLEHDAATVETASSAEEALALLQRRAPDVIVSDIGMPGMDGYALIRRVRSLDEKGVVDVPAIALTAFAREEDRALALASGYQAHMAKPVDPGELVATVARWAARG